MGIKIVGQIEKVSGKELSYTEFVQRYMEKNQPVVLTGLMEDWRACRDWVTDNGQPNLHFFATHFGKSKVQVADCGTREFTDQKRVEMSVSEFVDHWLGDNMLGGGSSSSHAVSGKSSLYLKDWHFVKEYPEYVAYITPLFFCDDWLNLYLDNYRMHKDSDIYSENNEISCSDYRFVYIGGKGTWTPLHADVFRSYSWSANVCGKKQWLFLSSSQSHLVYDRYMKNCVYDIFDDVNDAKFPGFKEALWLECTQEQNEIIFVPSGWYHQVHNLENTISINQNWFNTYNLSWVWDLILRDYNEAKESIEDIKDICDDFEELCQRNLAANTGMNFYDFFAFLAHISFANLFQLCYLLRDQKYPLSSLSPMSQHLILNLESIKTIAPRLNSSGGMSTNNGFFSDFRETTEDSKFLRFSTDLGQTYRVMHEQQKCDKALIDDIKALGIVGTLSCKLCCPEDLVTFIEHAIQNLSGIYCEGNVSLFGVISA